LKIKHVSDRENLAIGNQNSLVLKGSAIANLDRHIADEGRNGLGAGHNGRNAKQYRK
jgi:hypothetical protein